MDLYGYTNWESQKCPPFRKMLHRKALNEKNSNSQSSECQVALKNYYDCNHKAWMGFGIPDETKEDPSERDHCKFETAWLNCPKLLLGVCKTQAEIERMQYWELVKDDFEYENWDSDKCPVVKEVVTRWNALKESFKNSSEANSKKDESSGSGNDVVEETDLADKCKAIASCFECEQKAGCGWCSSPERLLSARCSTKEHNEEICPEEGREKKYTEDPVVLKEHVDLGPWMTPHFIQLRPKHVEMGLNVGEIKTLPFTYMYILNGNTYSHNLPDFIELKIFSDCGRSNETEVEGCHGILNGKTIHFKAQFRLKYCPKDASLWKGSYLISNTQGDYGKDDDLHVDIKLFCACSCDKLGTEKVCRNDKKEYLEINPCASKDSCTECLRNASCNWCSGSKYAHPDGSPLPRCNLDNFFASTLCPSKTKVDPP